jgi:hypothetical protein
MAALAARLAEPHLANTRYSAVETTKVNTNMSSQDAAVRHQAVVPDKIPTGEYPVSQLRAYALCNGRQ